ncbi:MobA/MobL family protein [Pararoseomonas sp. SCSIO 73927]|uniref:MobA/MobL family protein n=1 Tax=Pararoseomonas sp. SCSIO 73927 TaxID=3114537 RepID=UPI0030D38F8D
MARLERKGATLQISIIAELPHEVSSAARLRILSHFCMSELTSRGYPYWAVVHQPGLRNDSRNWHVHIIVYGRPGRLLPGGWSFDVLTPDEDRRLLAGEFPWGTGETPSELMKRLRGQIERSQDRSAILEWSDKLERASAVEDRIRELRRTGLRDGAVNKSRRRYPWGTESPATLRERLEHQLQTSRRGARYHQRWSTQLAEVKNWEAANPADRAPPTQAADLRAHDRGFIVELRSSWCAACNHELALAGAKKRYSPSSYAALGIDVVPSRHLGAKESAKEIAGRPTATAFENDRRARDDLRRLGMTDEQIETEALRDTLRRHLRNADNETALARTAGWTDRLRHWKAKADGIAAQLVGLRSIGIQVTPPCVSWPVGSSEQQRDRRAIILPSPLDTGFPPTLPELASDTDGTPASAPYSEPSGAVPAGDSVRIEIDGERISGRTPGAVRVPLPAGLRTATPIWCRRASRTAPLTAPSTLTSAAGLLEEVHMQLTSVGAASVAAPAPIQTTATPDGDAPLTTPTMTSVPATSIPTASTIVPPVASSGTLSNRLPGRPIEDAPSWYSSLITDRAIGAPPVRSIRVSWVTCIPSNPAGPEADALRWLLSREPTSQLYQRLHDTAAALAGSLGGGDRDRHQAGLEIVQDVLAATDEAKTPGIQRALHLDRVLRPVRAAARHVIIAASYLEPMLPGFRRSVTDHARKHAISDDAASRSDEMEMQFIGQYDASTEAKAQWSVLDRAIEALEGAVQVAAEGARRLRGFSPPFRREINALASTVRAATSWIPRHRSASAKPVDRIDRILDIRRMPAGWELMAGVAVLPPGPALDRQLKEVAATNAQADAAYERMRQLTGHPPIDPLIRKARLTEVVERITTLAEAVIERAQAAGKAAAAFGKGRQERHVSAPPSGAERTAYLRSPEGRVTYRGIVEAVGQIETFATQAVKVLAAIGGLSQSARMKISDLSRRAVTATSWLASRGSGERSISGRIDRALDIRRMPVSHAVFAAMRTEAMSTAWSRQQEMLGESAQAELVHEPSSQWEAPLLPAPSRAGSLPAAR